MKRKVAGHNNINLAAFSLSQLQLPVKQFQIAQVKAALTAGRADVGQMPGIGVTAHRRPADAQQNCGFVERKFGVAEPF